MRCSPVGLKWPGGENLKLSQSYHVSYLAGPTENSQERQLLQRTTIFEEKTIGKIDEANDAVSVSLRVQVPLQHSVRPGVRPGQ